MEAQRRLQLPRPRPGSPVRKKSTAHTYARNTHRKERLPPPGADQALALKMKVTRLRCQKCGRCWSDVPVIVSDVSPHVTADLADAMAHGLMDPDSPEALSLGIALTGIFLAMLYLRSSNLHGEPSVTGGGPAAAAGRRAVPTRAATGTDARQRPCAGSVPMRNIHGIKSEDYSNITTDISTEQRNWNGGGSVRRETGWTTAGELRARCARRRERVPARHTKSAREQDPGGHRPIIQRLLRGTAAKSGRSDARDDIVEQSNGKRSQRLVEKDVGVGQLEALVQPDPRRLPQTALLPTRYRDRRDSPGGQVRRGDLH